jgi:hypothetical protein
MSLYRRFHERFGTAGLVVAVIALAAALTGTAFAAKGALTSKQKKEVEKIAKKFAGKPGAPGATGPAGPQGPVGPKGDTGAQGAEGKEGPQGKEGKQGKEGSPWTAGGTLPSGKTETGTWSYNTTAFEFTVPFSFPIPLAAGLSESQVHLIGKSGKELILNTSTFVFEEVVPTKCGSALTPAGTVAKPAAAPGNLCVYVAKLPAVTEEHATSTVIVDPSDECEFFGCLTVASGPGAGTGPSGALLWLEGSEAHSETKGWGTWAVTAP